MKPRLSHNLPDQIVAVAMGTILVFGLTLELSLAWLVHAFDRQAQADSRHLVDRMLHGLVGRTVSVPTDYAKWDEAALHLAARDLDWLYPNNGSDAATGINANSSSSGAARSRGRSGGWTAARLPAWRAW